MTLFNRSDYTNESYILVKEDYYKFAVGKPLSSDGIMVLKYNEDGEIHPFLECNITRYMIYKGLSEKEIRSMSIEEKLTWVFLFSNGELRIV